MTNIVVKSERKAVLRVVYSLAENTCNEANRRFPIINEGIEHGTLQNIFRNLTRTKTLLMDVEQFSNCWCKL